MQRAIAQGTPVPDELLGPLRDSTSLLQDGPQLRNRLEEDGYLFLRGVAARQDVLAAREEVFQRLVEVDEIRPPAIEGIATGNSRRLELHPDLGAFWKSVNQGQALRRVSHGPATSALMDQVFGQASRAHDFMFLRPGVVGRSTNLHYDFPFFARGSKQIHTVWTALGEIPVCDGPLMVLENSHHFQDLIDIARQIDYDSAKSPTVQVLDNTVEFARQRKSRLLTADFGPGDLVIFTMFCMHGTLDNHSPISRVRLSCDVRWQPAADEIDPRYVGPNPAGTTGSGYGELNGAKPLTQPWHTR